MSQYTASNNARSTLAGTLAIDGLSLTVQNADKDLFPIITAGVNYTNVTLEDASNNIEIVKVTARASGSAAMTIERAQEGTVARAWNVGDTIECRPTAAPLIAALEHVGDSSAAHAASAIAYTPSGALEATNVQAGLDELEAEKAPKGAIGSAGLTVTTGKILGRTTAGTGAPEELDESLYARTNRAQTFAEKQIFANTTKFQASLEKATLIGVVSGSWNFDALTSAVQLATSNASNHWQINLRGDGSNTLNSLMAAGESITIAMAVPMSATPYYMNGFYIDGVLQTVNWIGGVAPSAGWASCLNVYSFTIFKLGSGSYRVVGSLSRTT